MNIHAWMGYIDMRTCIHTHTHTNTHTHTHTHTHTQTHTHTHTHDYTVPPHRSTHPSTARSDRAPRAWARAARPSASALRAQTQNKTPLLRPSGACGRTQRAPNEARRWAECLSGNGPKWEQALLGAGLSGNGTSPEGSAKADGMRCTATASGSLEYSYSSSTP